MLCNRVDPEQTLRVVRLILDALHHPPLNPLAGLVDDVVLLTHLAGERGVAFDDGVEALTNHLLRLRGHRADLGGKIIRAAPLKLRHPLGDVLGEVAHPLQVVVDLQGGDDKPQVGRHGLVEGEDLQALLFHLHFHAVDVFVAGHHPLGQRGVTVDEGGDRLRDRLLHEGAEAEDPLLEILELTFDVFGHSEWGADQPKRPVT